MPAGPTQLIDINHQRGRIAVRPRHQGARCTQRRPQLESTSSVNCGSPRVLSVNGNHGGNRSIAKENDISTRRKCRHIYAAWRARNIQVNLFDITVNLNGVQTSMIEEKFRRVYATACIRGHRETIVASLRNNPNSRLRPSYSLLGCCTHRHTLGIHPQLGRRKNESSSRARSTKLIYKLLSYTGQIIRTIYPANSY